MYSIETNTLNETNVTQTVLATVEDICQQFGLNKDFAYISLTSQIISEYLSSSHKNTIVNFSAYVDTDILSLFFSSNQAVFQNFLIEFKEMEVLRLLSDSIEVSLDHKTISLNFHVKPKPKQLRQNKLKYHIHQNTKSI